MRKVLIATAVGVALGSAMLATAGTRDESQPEARAYMNFNFGGAAALPKNFHYGMRLDYDHRYLMHPMPAIVQMDFNDAGFSSARLNGLPFARRVYLNQTEGAIGGAATAGAGGGAAAVTVVDWSLLAAGAVGLGFAGYEVADNAKSDTQPAPSSTGSSTGGSTAGGSTTGSTTGGSTTGSATGSTTGGSTTGGSTTGGSTTGGSTTGGSTTGGSTTGGGLLGTGLLGFAELDMSSEATHHTSEYQEWLDGGTGHMGDLAPAK